MDVVLSQMARCCFHEIISYPNGAIFRYGSSFEAKGSYLATLVRIFCQTAQNNVMAPVFRKNAI
jgi:hypothetical protein